MTTAHRPTFVPRKGNNIYTDIPTLQFSVKDLPSNTILKMRFNEKDGRYYNEDDFIKPKNREDERKRMIKELKKREREEKRKKQKEEENELLFYPNKRKKISEKDSEKIIKKDEFENNNVEKEKQNNNEEENEEDSEEELMRELEKIKREQEEENKRKNEEIKEKMEKEMDDLKEKKVEKEKETENSIGISFDLNDNNFSSFSLSKPEEFSLKKKWYEESVFKNQSRKEIKPKKRFINDSVHSDFHYIFLDKVIQ